MSKFEKLLDLLVNEQKDEAEKVFHEIVVEKSRQIYEGILADEEANEETVESAEEVEEASDKDEDAETTEVDEAQDEDVDEAMHGDKDKMKKKKKKMEDEVDESEETEETDESAEETIEEIGGDATDDLISDIEAEGEGDDMDMGDDDMDMDGDGDADPEAEEMFEPLEKELDALKAEFAKMMDSDDDKGADESVNPFEDAEPKDADTIVKEYADMVKAGHGAEKMGKETGADSKKSVVASKNKPMTNAGAVKMDVGGEEKGGVGKALTGDTAKPMGDSFKNAGGIKSATQEKAPAAMEKPAGEDNTKSPVATK